ncbi:MAG: Xaa-Pro dipeptidyl-peptidase [Planctomycetes bacterium]|nr:Xaa-Pro dipeptidyl-peptidase [Planctomycetota bacterium]
MPEPRRHDVLPFLFALAVAPVATAQQDPPAEKAAPVFVDGMAQVVDAFRSPREWIREWCFVETDFDTDGDGKKDRMHVDVTRPQQTDSEGLKVPVVYETSPYFAGTGPMSLDYYWDVEQEVDTPPPPRPQMKPIPFGKQPGMISREEVNTWVPRGFAVVHSCSPGTGFSQGCPTLGGDNESLAPAAVVDWLCGRRKAYKTLDGDEQVEAKWCSGKVGMIGTSYNGTLPIACATTGVEGLATIVPISPNTSYYHYYRSNGLVRSPGGYLGEDIDVLFDFIHSGDPDKRAWCVEHWRDGVLRKGFDRTFGDWNAFWAERDYLLDMGPLKTPMLMAHGFNDWNVMPEHTVRIYAELKKKGVPCMAYFHQGGHGGPPPMTLLNRWFTRFLYGVDNGIEKEPKAWIVRENDRMGDPTPYADYPNPDAAPVLLHLQGDGGKAGALVLGKGSDEKQKLIDDVSLSGGKLAAEAESPNRLLFVTPELRQPLHLSGTARITIRVASSKPAANLSIWLVSLPWQPSRKPNDNIVTRGWADPQNHASIADGEPMVPGAFYDMAFDLQPDDQIVPAGQRLGLMIFSSDREFTLWPQPGTELTVDLAGTSLTLPVVGGGDAFSAASGGR